MGSLITEPEDWLYFSFHPYAGFDFREVEHGLFEQFAIRDEKHVDLFQGYFHTSPDLAELSSKDLYRAHPTEPGLWRFEGRTDDLIVLSSGEKLHPIGFEEIVNRHTAVAASLLVSCQRIP